MSAASSAEPVRPLAKLQACIAKYVVTTDAQRLVIALWIVHTHLVQLLDQTPYLLITSPQKQCGKSRLLELLELLTPRPFVAIMPSEPVVYRTIDAELPTLLLDEIDGIFAPKNADRYEGLRAILNAGHRKSARVPRCVGVSLTPKYFKVFSAKALAGIGVVPDTISDRSIPIRLQRKTREEKVTPFRRREVEKVTAPILDGIAKWAETYGQWVSEQRPEMPQELSDRMLDGCEPLVAIADGLGYGVEARAALVELLAGERQDERENAEMRLLHDIRVIFDEQDVHVISTLRLVSALLANGNGWGDWYGHGLTSRDVSMLLRGYGVKVQSIRADGVVARGYKRDDFVDQWKRYLPANDFAGVTLVTDSLGAEE